MTREEKLQRALKYSDFYELALLTYEGSKDHEDRSKTNQE